MQASLGHAVSPVQAEPYLTPSKRRDVTKAAAFSP
jgi:hypothetical protein